MKKDERRSHHSLDRKVLCSCFRLDSLVSGVDSGLVSRSRSWISSAAYTVKYQHISNSVM